VSDVILCIDVGNSHLFGGVFDGENLLLRFRLNSKVSTSDEIGIFLKNVLRENGILPDAIKQCVLCSVVPSLDYSLRAACLKYFSIQPFMIQSGIKTGIKIRYRNPLELGADRIANAIAATKIYPDKNIILIDFGTAVTFCALSKDKTYLGGTILAGVRLCMEALETHAAKLPPVEIIRPKQCIGRSTVESIQAGLYYSTLGGAREIIKQIKQEAFEDKDVVVIGTGGFASLFDGEALFDVNLPDLVLEGLRLALTLNESG
jgi:type III pantothenate kinase